MPSNAELYNEYQEGLSYGEIAAKYGLTYDLVRGRIRRLINKVSLLPQEVNTLKSRIRELEEQIEQEDSSMYEPSARDDTDIEKWKLVVRRLKDLPRMVKVMAFNDIHFPDHDPQALELAHQIATYFQPDICIVGSDAFDFDVLSLKFKRMFNRKRRDPFEEVYPFWDVMTRRLERDVPGTTMVAIGDNHAQGRLEKFINETANPFADRLTSDFNELVRNGGRVLWLGWSQEVRIGPALFEHGKKTGANPAQQGAKARGWISPRIGGHAHRPATNVVVGEITGEDGTSAFHYPIVSINTGCLCHLNPHYITDTHCSDWVHGVGLAHINMNGLDSHFQNVLFHTRKDGAMVTALGEKTFGVLPTLETGVS